MMTSEPNNEEWYFAYGANMSTRVFLEQRRMQVSHRERALLEDHRLVFNEPGAIPFVEPAFANIEPADAQEVHGVLWRVKRDDLERLHLSESSNYEALRIEVHGEDAGPVEAVAYRSRLTVPGLKPSRRYRDVILSGAREHDLPETYCESLERVPTAYVPVASEAFDAILPAFLRAREKGFRPEVIYHTLLKHRRR